jgi:hypothetical protein
MSLDTLTLNPGDTVTYDDMSNPLTAYTVIEKVTDRWGTFFRLTPEGERYDSVADLKTSDCRQHGWNLVKETP